MSKYGLSADRVVRHYDASRKCCPCSFSANNWAKWNEFKSRLAGQAPVQAINNNVGDDYMSRKYQNGSSVEYIFADCNLTKQVGSLNPWEVATAVCDVNGRIGIVYEGVDENGVKCNKIGFTKYRGGL
jgi:hypothetical protein